MYWFTSTRILTVLVQPKTVLCAIYKGHFRQPAIQFWPGTEWFPYFPWTEDMATRQPFQTRRKASIQRQDSLKLVDGNILWGEHWMRQMPQYLRCSLVFYLWPIGSWKNIPRANERMQIIKKRKILLFWFV